MTLKGVPSQTHIVLCNESSSPRTISPKKGTNVYSKVWNFIGKPLRRCKSFGNYTNATTATIHPEIEVLKRCSKSCNAISKEWQMVLVIEEIEEYQKIPSCIRSSSLPKMQRRRTYQAKCCNCHRLFFKSMVNLDLKKEEEKEEKEEKMFCSIDCKSSYDYRNQLDDIIHDQLLINEETFDEDEMEEEKESSARLKSKNRSNRSSPGLFVSA
jgi:hypothetical protein